MNSSHQVLVEFLDIKLKGTERAYLEGLQGTVAVSLNQCWVDTESVESFIKKFAPTKRKKLSIIHKRIAVIRKVLKDKGYDDPTGIELGLDTLTLAEFYDLCRLENDELFRGISHPDESESFRTEVWAKAKKIFFDEKQKHNTVG